MHLHNLTIGNRLWFGIGAMVILGVVAGLIGIIGLKQQHRHVDDALKFEVGLYRHVSDIRFQMGNLRRYEKDVLLSIDYAEKRKEYADKWNGAAETVQAAIAPALGLSQDQQEKVTVKQLSEQRSTDASRATELATALRGLAGDVENLLARFRIHA